MGLFLRAGENIIYFFRGYLDTCAFIQGSARVGFFNYNTNTDDGYNNVHGGGNEKGIFLLWVTV